MHLFISVTLYAVQYILYIVLEQMFTYRTYFCGFCGKLKRRTLWILDTIFSDNGTCADCSFFASFLRRKRYYIGQISYDKNISPEIHHMYILLFESWKYTVHICLYPSAVNFRVK